MARREEGTDLGPSLTDLAGFGARLFPRQRAETGEIQLVRRGVGHPTIIRPWFQNFYSKYPNSFGIFQFGGSQRLSFGKFQHVSEGFNSDAATVWSGAAESW